MCSDLVFCPLCLCGFNAHNLILKPLKTTVASKKEMSNTELAVFQQCIPFFPDIKRCKYFSMTTGLAPNWNWSLVVMRLSLAFTLTSSTLSKFRSALFLLSSRISIFSSSTSACCSSSSQTSSSSS